MHKATEQGLYQPGETLLHRLDPRIKVLASLLLVILAFAAHDWTQLLTLMTTLALAFWLLPSLAGSALRLSWMIRWLLLFTMLMHLFFSPGRTLWGLRWLSLDGLITGLFVSVQMLLAIMVSVLLAMTTSTEHLARTFGWFVKPLNGVGCRTEEWQKTLLLAMDFIPVVQEEIHASTTADHGNLASAARGWGERCSLWMQKLEDFLMRLVSRGDAIAHRLAKDEGSERLPALLSPLLPLSLLDQLFSLTIILLILCYWFT